MDSKREQWADIMKGICILCVILGHMVIPSRLLNTLFSFHMPAFFLISGYFMSPKPFWNSAVKRAKKLFVPYCIASVFIILSYFAHNIYLLTDRTQFIQALMKWLWAAFYASGNNYSSPVYIKQIGALWFLFALWFSQLIVNYAIQQKRSWVTVGIVAAMSIAGYVTSKTLWLPFSVQAGMTASFYVYCGYLVKKHSLITEAKITASILAACFAIWIFYLWMGGGHLYMVGNYYKYGVLEALGSLCACTVIFAASRFLEQHSTYIKAALSWIGRNTLSILCFHIVELNTFQWGRFSFLNATWSLFLAKTMYCVLGTVLVNTIKKSFSKRRSEKAVSLVPLQARNRLEWVDFSRGAVLLLMVLGHCSVNEKLYRIIFSFHMPFFFIISGYLFQENRPFSTLIKHKAKGLLLPYLAFQVLTWFVDVWKQKFYNNITVANAIEITIKEIKSTLFGMSFSSTLFQNISGVGPIWFVLCLFWSILLFAVIHRITSGRAPVWELVAVSSCCILGVYIGKNVAYLPHSFDVSLVGVAFLYAGFCIRKYSVLERMSSCVLCLITAFIWCGGIYLGYIEMAVRSYPYFPVCVLSAIAGSILVMRLSMDLCRIGTISDFLCFWGTNSMIVLGVHKLEQCFVSWGTILADSSAVTLWIIRVILITSILMLYCTLSCFLKTVKRQKAAAACEEAL